MRRYSVRQSVRFVVVTSWDKDCNSIASGAVITLA
jgi:hypothetical protein